MSVISSALKFAARTSWVFVSSLSGFTLFGLVLNIVLFFLLPDRCAVQGSLGAIIADCADAVLIGLLFLPILPILYAILGYRFAIQRTLHFGYVQNREFFFRYLIDRFVNFAQKYAGGGIANATGLATRFLDHLDDLPFAIRAIVRVVKKFVPMADLLDRVNATQLIDANNRDTIAAQIATEADHYLKNELLYPDTTLPKILVAANLIAFVLLRWVF